jgi:hypothetical protein
LASIPGDGRQGLGGGLGSIPFPREENTFVFENINSTYMLSRLASDNVAPVATRGVCASGASFVDLFSSNLRLSIFPISDAPCHLRFISQPEGSNDAEGLLQHQYDTSPFLHIHSP